MTPHCSTAELTTDSFSKEMSVQAIKETQRHRCYKIITVFSPQINGMLKRSVWIYIYTLKQSPKGELLVVSMFSQLKKKKGKKKKEKRTNSKKLMAATLTF